MSLAITDLSAAPRADAADLDLRDMLPPEPMVRALAAADALAPGKTLCVLTPMLPIPLLEILSTRGLRCVAELLAEGGARVLIARPASNDKTDD